MRTAKLGMEAYFLVTVFKLWTGDKGMALPEEMCCGVTGNEGVKVLDGRHAGVRHGVDGVSSSYLLHRVSCKNSTELQG